MRLPMSCIASMAVAAAACTSMAGVQAARYIVVDLAVSPNGRCAVHGLAEMPAGGWTDEYKTDKMVLRCVPCGTFMMGAPPGERGRNYLGDYERRHKVTVSKPFYIGVFEVTQAQWRRLMGNSPSQLAGDTRPVEQVSYNEIRGGRLGSRWPADGGVDAGSFLGRLRDRTGLLFDLPTEAQWEYACRAGTDTALNSGKNLSSGKECPNMAEVGRYGFNPGVGANEGHAAVGSYRPNAWGLYDMHGNVAEWCLYWWQGDLGTTEQVDPKGPASGSWRALRGGCWDGLIFVGHAAACRSASRAAHDGLGCANPMNASLYWGLRVACPVDEKLVGE